MGSSKTIAAAMPKLPAYVAGSDTSKAAAESVRESASSIRACILSSIAAHGATCDEIEYTLGLRHQTCSARLRELALQSRIVDSGLRRATRSGRRAVVWRAA